MGQEIVYCFKCQKRILGIEFAKGLAYQVGNNVSCAGCAADLLQTLSGRDREQLLAKMFKATQERKGASPSEASDGSGSPERHKATARAVVAAAPGSTRAGAGPLALGLGVVGALAVVAVIFLSSSGERKVPPETATAPKAVAPPRPPTPAAASIFPEEARRIEAARAALKKARDFAQANPDKLPAQIQEWEEARRIAEGTPFFDEAKRELADLANRRRTLITRELADLETRAAGRLKAEEFKAASDFILAARGRFDTDDWTSAIDQRVREIHENATRLLTLVAERAVDAQKRQAAADVQSTRERVLKWGYPELATQLDASLAAAGAPPSPPPGKEPEPVAPPKPAVSEAAKVADPKEAPSSKATPAASTKKPKSPIDAGLIGHWKFDETKGAVAVDASPSGNNGLLKGATLPVPGKVGSGALALDGTSGYVGMAHLDVLNAFPISLCAWVKTTGRSGGIVGKYMSGSFNGYLVVLFEGQLHAWYFKDKANCVWDEHVTAFGLNGGKISDGAWHHVSFVVDKEGGRLYVDGNQKAAMGWTGSPGVTSTSQDLEVGHYPTRVVAPESFFSGSIDDVRIYNRALSEAEVRQLATSK